MVNGKLNIDEQRCLAKKKVSFSQKSSLDTKKSKKRDSLDSIGLKFTFLPEEVIESAEFVKTVRDCRGDVIRKNKLRRFRKVSSDEWFSYPSLEGNKIWSKDFESVTEKKVLEQAKKNEMELAKTKSSEETGVKNMLMLIGLASFIGVGYFLLLETS